MSTFEALAAAARCVGYDLAMGAALWLLHRAQDLVHRLDVLGDRWGL